MKRIRVGAIIVHEDKVMVLWRRVNGQEYFVFPGGRVEEGETLEQTVVRETREETSLEVKVLKFLYKLTDENNEQNFFLCEYISGEPKKEISEKDVMPAWYSINTLHELNLLPLEVRDWFLSDVKENFIKCPREANIAIADRRKI